MTIAARTPTPRDARHGTTTTVAASDGTEILARRWPAAGDAWASVLLVHGIAEHSGRYDAVGARMAEAGLDVHAYDQRGFGGSGGRRAWVESWSVHHDDVEERLEAVRSESGDRPVVLFGHSLGGLLALGYVVADPARPLPDALVLSAPALESSVPSWKRGLVRVLNAAAPRTLVANGFDGAVLSRDPAVGIAYLADPLNERRTTARFGVEAMQEQARVMAALDRLSVPTLVYHGEADRLVPMSASTPLEGRPGVVRRTWPGLRHESHNEPEGDAVIDAAIAWMRATVNATDIGS